MQCFSHLAEDKVANFESESVPLHSKDTKLESLSNVNRGFETPDLIINDGKSLSSGSSGSDPELQ